MAQERGTLKPRQAAAIEALLDPANGSTVKAAKACNVPLRTLNRWLFEDPAFVAALRQAEGAMIDESVRRLVSIASAADAVIYSIMADKTLHASIRLRAAGMAKESLMRERELRNTEARLAEIEARLDAKGL